ncbi:MAG: class I SAM-dependent methyltransferase [Chloroflexia bacterium]|nr:class I SAM-dependent methyltransferase [Chloroflexia bacterium]
MELREYTEKELQVIADEVGERQGWDFSRMSTEREPVPWDYIDVVSRFLRPTDMVLDVGTGGGERLLSLADRYRRAVGVDPDPEMLRVARGNAGRHSNVRFLLAPAERLEPLDDGAFDVVLTRHAPAFVPELDRVTKAGGLFICQGVGSRNMANVRRAFNTSSEALYVDAYQTMLSDLAARGWRLVAEGHYDVCYWVKDVPSIVFWFQAIAGANEVPGEFSIAKHYGVINALIQRFGSDLGLETNEHRTLVIARKPDA